MKNDEKPIERNSIKLKLRFYIMSLWLLFVFMFFLTIDIPISFAPDSKFIGIDSLIKRNVHSLISIIFVIISAFSFFQTEYEWKGTYNTFYTIESVKNENYEYLTFLTSFVIPLACIDLRNTRYFLILLLLLICFGKIFISMDLYFGNPTLALVGYRLYRVKIENFADEIIVITKDKLAPQSKINWIKLGDNVWTVKEVK